MNVMTLIRQARESNNFSLLSEAIPYMRSLGMTVSEQDGELITTMRAEHKLAGNPWIPALHGGTIGGLLETAAIIQLAHDHDSESLPKPINITVEYLRTGFIKDLHAHATVTKQGRRVANVRVLCWQENRDKPVASMHGHFLMS